MIRVTCESCAILTNALSSLNVYFPDASYVVLRHGPGTGYDILLVSNVVAARLDEIAQRLCREFDASVLAVLADDAPTEEAAP